MSCSRTPSIVFVMICFLFGLLERSYAQSDAETALQNARIAFQNELFERARDLADRASQTDAKNPDVWLLLGKAHFQLGELDEALGAWRELLELSPEHEFGRRMVTALEGRTSDVDTRLALIPE